MSYHQQLIEKFSQNLGYFGLEFEPVKINKNLVWERGEIDIEVIGKLEKTLVEVKSNPKQLDKFTKKQYCLYRQYDPEANIYLLMGNREYSLQINDLFFKRFWPI
ncbi:MAG: hypothetical protein ACQESF_05895 [Nanobdellota archaeon]